ncbi:MAG: nucleotidyltransferase domain-containing protein [Promethearchaeota archaeon]|nr:MAG: nucleotidyltransferase domain-containing protein [Candidatus Lokiarchaeota archaeon]
MERVKYKIISIDELERTIANISKNHDEILLCYLYGSYVSGNKTEFSDIDIGILLDNAFKKHYLYQVELSLEIEKEFDNKIEIDLCILNEATPRFLYNVIKSGHNIYSKEKKIQYEYEIRILYYYLDIKPMLDMYDKITIMEALKN